ncbi:hypothetical protein QYF61_018784 [Mycteria americana]|uniref:Uncharacterized protein n=1 Tax=Mycteria americana TaxID=33587 RepID=A0AAN7NN92_MYCAM|nr:hypothetical protein QYF61_018784 [Mycteria americana]
MHPSFKLEELHCGILKKPRSPQRSDGSLAMFSRTIEWFGLEGTLKIISFQRPCHGQGRLPLDQVAQSPIQPGLEHFQGWGIHSFPGQPVPAPFRYWKAARRCPQSLLFSRLNNPNSLSLSSQERCSSPRIIFVALLWTHSNSSMSFLCWGPQRLNAVLQAGSHESGVEEENHLPRPAGHCSFDAAQDMVGFLGCKCTLPRHDEPLIDQHPQALLLTAALNSNHTDARDRAVFDLLKWANMPKSILQPPGLIQVCIPIYERRFFAMLLITAPV